MNEPTQTAAKPETKKKDTSYVSGTFKKTPEQMKADTNKAQQPENTYNRKSK